MSAAGISYATTALGQFSASATLTRQAVSANVPSKRVRALIDSHEYMQETERGWLKHDARQFEGALVHLNRAIELNPSFSWAHLCRANCLRQVRRFAEAMDAMAIAKKLNYRNGKIHLADAELSLSCGDFVRGWKEFEWRRELPEYLQTRGSFTVPLWLGDTWIDGKIILLWGEEGLGDSLQFCRYVPLVRAMGAHVVLLIQEELRELCFSLGENLDVLSKSKLHSFPAHVHCPLMSLPLALRTTLQTIPAQVPYLRAPRRDWSSLLGSTRRPRIGLQWLGESRPKSG